MDLVGILIFQGLIFEPRLITSLHFSFLFISHTLDSVLLAIKGVEEEEALRKITHIMDFSNFDATHSLYDTRYKKMPGKLKCETPNTRILRTVALKAKSYIFETEAGLKATAKGVIRSARQRLSFDDYKRCLDTISSVTIKQNVINSKNHVNRLLSAQRIAFSSVDDKRYQTCPIHSVPYGSILADYHQITNRCHFCNVSPLRHY